MQVVWANAGHSMHEAIGEFVSFRLYGHPGAFRDYTAMGVFQDGTMIAGLVYYDYDRQAGVIQISGASDSARWLTKPVLWEMFAFCFREIGCQSVVMRVDPSNERLGSMLKRYGFRDHRLPRLRGRDRDDIIYILHDNVWESNGYHRENIVKEAG